MAAGTFLLVITEFLPTSLLSRLTHDLHVYEGIAGLSVTARELIASFAAPPFVLLAGTLDRRTIIILLTAAIVLSNAVSVAAQSFPLFLLDEPSWAWL